MASNLVTQSSLEYYKKMFIIRLSSRRVYFPPLSYYRSLTYRCPTHTQWSVGQLKILIIINVQVRKPEVTKNEINLMEYVAFFFPQTDKVL